MVVQLKFFAGLRAFLPAGESTVAVELQAGTTIAEVFRRFGVPPDTPRIILVNGRHTDPERILADGDLLAVFPPVAGG